MALESMGSIDGRKRSSSGVSRTVIYLENLSFLSNIFSNMTTRLMTAIIFGIILNLTCFAETVLTPVSKATQKDEYLPFWSIITDIPQTAWSGTKTAFSRDSLPQWGLLIGSTALLYHYDEDILLDVQAKGRSWKIGNQERTKTLVQVGNVALLRGPSDTASLLYFLGDGTIPIVVSGSLIASGYYGKHSHAYNTGIEMANGLLTATIFDQVIKRVGGRESPSQQTQNRGKWQPFPNLKKYSHATAKYDAMPSGHIMTATVMFTVVEEEYSEYNYIWYPAEVAWLGILGFGMMNNGVHWASDYPLGIALGYLFGRTAVGLHKAKDEIKTTSQFRWYPGMHPETGTPTVNALYTW
jgi:hypothetical protein